MERLLLQWIMIIMASCTVAVIYTVQPGIASLEKIAEALEVHHALPKG